MDQWLTVVRAHGLIRCVVVPPAERIREQYAVLVERELRPRPELLHVTGDLGRRVFFGQATSRKRERNEGEEGVVSSHTGLRFQSRSSSAISK